jgi:hypothetical protein
VDRTFTLDEARQVLGEMRASLDELVTVRAELATQAHAHNSGAHVSIADIKALEARMGELLDGYRARGVQVKGYAPLLLDFPMQVGDRTVLLCWLEGEDELGWYHETATGFMGRLPLDRLPW